MTEIERLARAQTDPTWAAQWYPTEGDIGDPHYRRVDDAERVPPGVVVIGLAVACFIAWAVIAAVGLMFYSMLTGG
jgi:hypothetical protein